MFATVGHKQLAHNNCDLLIAEQLTDNKVELFAHNATHALCVRAGCLLVSVCVFADWKIQQTAAVVGRACASNS